MRRPTPEQRRRERLVTSALVFVFFMAVASIPVGIAVAVRWVIA